MSVTHGWSHVKIARKWIGALGVAAGIGLPLLPAARAEGLPDQLKLLQTQQTAAQKERFEKAEEKAVNQELKYAPGTLLGRGAVVLYGDQNNNRDFPLGYPGAGVWDSTLVGEDGTTFMIAVSRQDAVPCAVKKFRTKDLQFPFVFELLDSDLVFPYTREAWAAGTQASDSLVITTIMSPGSKLVEPQANTRLGYAISEPVNIAGSLQRSTARIVVSNKVHHSKYMNYTCGFKPLGLLLALTPHFLSLSCDASFCTSFVLLNDKVDSRLYTAEETALLKNLDDALKDRPFGEPVDAGLSNISAATSAAAVGANQ